MNILIHLNICLALVSATVLDTISITDSVNILRAQYGAPPVAYSEGLGRSANKHARFNAKNRVLNRNAPISPSEMAAQEQVEVSSAGAAICSTGTFNIRRLMEKMGSRTVDPVNLEVIRNPAYNSIGVGTAQAQGRTYWVFHMANIQPAAPKPSPPPAPPKKDCPDCNCNCGSDTTVVAMPRSSPIVAVQQNKPEVVVAAPRPNIPVPRQVIPVMVVSEPKSNFNGILNHPTASNIPRESPFAMPVGYPNNPIQMPAGYDARGQPIYL